MGILVVHFYPAGSIKNPIVLTENMYHKGSLNIVPNSQKLVNRLLVKGGQAVSASAYSQAITAGTIPIPLYYYPRSPVVVTIGGIVKTLGIQNIDAAGTYDFLLNATEKLLIPDQCTTGTGTVDYYYEYPIKIILEEPSSQSQYGIFDDILMADTNDNDIALELGLKHLYKYSQPILAGSVKPFTGDFRAGQTIRVTVPRLAINHDLLIKEVTLSSTPGKPVEIALTLEEPERDIGSLLKKMQKRLAKLEAEVYSDNDGPLERYISKSDKCNWTEGFTNSVYVYTVSAFLESLLSSSPMFLWKLDDSGTTIADATSNSIGGTATDVTPRAAGINAMIPFSASFNGASSLIAGAAGCSVRGLAAFTFVAAVKMPAVVAEEQLWFEPCGDSAGWERLCIYVGAAGNLTVRARSGIHTQTVFPKTSDDAFLVADLETLIHIVVDIANDSILMYKDGLLIASNGAQGFGADTIVVDTAPAAVPQIGKFTDAAPRWLSGNMAFTGIFPTALSAATILAQAQAGGFAEITETPNYDVMDYGTVGTDDEANDDTAAIQAAIDAAFIDGIATVKIPDGTYWVDPDVCILPKSGVSLWLTSGATIKCKRTSTGDNAVVHFNGVSNSGIIGGYIVGDRHIHTGATGEQGFGIRITSSTNIIVDGVDVSDCWGDGIIVDGRVWAQKYSQNVLIKNVVCDGNRRQGLTVASVKGLTVKDSAFKNTDGTNPKAGIDIEPYASNQSIQDVLFDNCVMQDNVGWGFDMWFKHLIGSGNDVTMAINNCTYSANGSGPLRYAAGIPSSEDYFEYLNIRVDGTQIGNVAKYGA